MDRSVYDEMARLDEDHWWYRGRRRIVSDLIARAARPPAGAKVVEIGCGMGSNLPMLAPFGDLVAIEPDEQARAFAARRSGATVLDGRLPDGLPFAPGSIDLAVMLDVLEHVDDDRGSLRAVETALKPGGRLVLTVPAAPMLWSRHDERHHHKRRYTADTLRAAVAASGLEVEVLTHFNTLLFPMIAGVRGLKKATGDESADTGMPAAWLNRTLETVFAFERHVVGRVPLPAGVSLVAVLRRPL